MQLLILSYCSCRDAVAVCGAVKDECLLLGYFHFLVVGLMGIMGIMGFIGLIGGIGGDGDGW